MERKLNVGDILASKYVYGCETQLYTYYKVVKVLGDGNKVRLQKLRKHIVYEGLPPYYYDTPRTSFPLNMEAEDKTILRSVKYDDGWPVVKTEEYSRSYGVWDGEPLEEYNLH